MNEDIDRFLNSEAGRKAVEAMAHHIFGNNTETWTEVTRLGLRVYLLSLSEQGAMRDAVGYDYGNQAAAETDLAPSSTTYAAFILRVE